MAKSKNKITLSGNTEILHDIERLGGNVPKTIIEAIELSGKHATTRYVDTIKKHHISGLTEDAIILNPKAKQEGSKIVMETGFDIDNGGLPAIYLDRGTPKQKPTNFIRKIKKDKVVTGAIGYVLGEAWRKNNK